MPWPDYVHIVVPGQQIGQDTNVERSRFEDGFVRQEKRYTSALYTWQTLVLIKSDTDLDRFRRWADDEAHSWFTWGDVVSGQTRRVRVRDGAGGINYTPFVQAGARRWEAAMILEGWSNGVA